MKVRVEEEYVTAGELSLIFRKTKRHISERYAYDPTFPKPKWEGRQRVWPLAACERWFAERSGPDFRIGAKEKEAA